ncbi:hypothetical protein ACWEOZ_32780 [Actinoplanes sp. NPDC004185]
MAWEWIGGTLLGLAGVGATVWSGNKQRTSQEKLVVANAVQQKQAAQDSEKRRTYMQAYRTAEDFLHCAAMVAVYRETLPDDSEIRHLDEMKASRKQLTNALSELLIFGSSPVCVAAIQLRQDSGRLLVTAAQGNRSFDPYHKSMSEMLNAMRQEFGLPGGTIVLDEDQTTQDRINDDAESD